MATRKIVLTLVLLGGLATTTATTPVTCKADTFSDGERASVTCLFHKDIRVSKPGVNVLRYRLNASSISEERDVLQCMWPKNSEKPDCIVDRGYLFDHVISDRLTLEVPSASERVAGLYICHVVPQDDFQPHACDLTVNAKKRNHLLAIPPNTESSDDRTTPTTNGRWPCRDSDCSGERTALVAVTSILSVLLVATTVSTVVCFKRRERNRITQQENHTDRTLSEDERQSLLSEERATPTQDMIAAEEGDSRQVTAEVCNPTADGGEHAEADSKAVACNGQCKNSNKQSYSAKTLLDGIPYSDKDDSGMGCILTYRSCKTSSRGKQSQVSPKALMLCTISAKGDQTDLNELPSLWHRVKLESGWGWKNRSRG